MDRHLVCEPCGPTVAGGFDPDQTQVDACLCISSVQCQLVSASPQVVLCENNIYSQGHMNDTLTHELVHAYDHCRAHVDWSNLQHIACTEVSCAHPTNHLSLSTHKLPRLWEEPQELGLLGTRVTHDIPCSWSCSGEA